MGEVSARLGLPMLAVGQAQKEVTHNEALAMLDIGAHPCVEGVGLDAAPAGAAPGQSWIVGAAPTGAWAGHAGALAGWTGGGWRFVPATEGLSAWVRPAGQLVRYANGAWRRPAAVAAPAGGAVSDAEARAAVAAILSVLRTHGLIAAG